MHALYESRHDIDPRLIASVLLVQHAPSHEQIYAIVLKDHEENGAVVEGAFLVNSFLGRILFDSETSHSFISQSFMHRLHLIPDTLDIPLSVATPLGDLSILELVHRGCVISLDDVELRLILSFILCLSLMSFWVLISCYPTM